MLLRAVLLAAFAAVVAGTFLPWSENPPFSETGLESTDGVVVLVLGLGGIAMTVFGRRPRAVLIATSCGALCLLFALLKLADVSGEGPAKAATGLYVTLGGSLASIAAGSLQTFSILRKPGETPPAAEITPPPV